MISREVSPEVLDKLPQDDPLAMRSRRDLRRVHAAMGTRFILLHALQSMPALRQTRAPLRLLELGAGDGSLMLGVARMLARTKAPPWSQVHLTLLDVQPLITHDTVANYADLGWTAAACVRDVFEWAASPPTVDHRGYPSAPWDLTVSNLFLHHFEGPQLSGLLRAIADRSHRFLACEPSRTWVSLVGSHLVGAIGANAVTREDAVLSVHAGFRGNEITALWPDVGDKWEVQENAAGLFSHCFRAEPIAAD